MGWNPDTFYRANHSLWARATKESKARTESPGKAEIPESLIGHPTYDSCICNADDNMTKHASQNTQLWPVKGRLLQGKLARSHWTGGNDLTGRQRNTPWNLAWRPKIWNPVKTNLYLCYHTGYFFQCLTPLISLRGNLISPLSALRLVLLQNFPPSFSSSPSPV